ncbi:hypothetical protein AB0L10_23120 [Streptomyces flaveolus]|uniref:hypothetical protein n=1 Tax=Streptomyces flaveolus TaxID=67297 RepID=UPI003440A0FF
MGPAGYTSHLLGSLALALDTAGTGVWRPDGVITVDESGILRAVVPAEPCRAIGLTAYPLEAGSRFHTVRRPASPRRPRR